MTFTIDLTPETEARLQEEASAQGVDAPALARRLIEQALPKKPLTGAEAIAIWEKEGVLGLFADRPPTEEFARQLRREVWTRAGDTDASEQDPA